MCLCVYVYIYCYLSNLFFMYSYTAIYTNMTCVSIFSSRAGPLRGKLDDGLQPVIELRDNPIYIGLTRALLALAG